MLNIAFIGPRFQDQLEANPAALSGMEVVWSGPNVDSYLKEGRFAQAVVIVCDLQDLGDLPAPRVEELLQDRQVERVIVTYSFARRSILASLQRPGVRVVQGPIPLANLRAQIVDLIVRDILEDQGPPTPPLPKTRCPECGSRLPAQPEPA